MNARARAIVSLTQLTPSQVFEQRDERQEMEKALHFPTSKNEGKLFERQIRQTRRRSPPNCTYLCFVLQFIVLLVNVAFIFVIKLSLLAWEVLVICFLTSISNYGGREG